MSGPYDELTEDELLRMSGRFHDDERCLFALPVDVWNAVAGWWARLRRRFERG